MPMKLYKKEEVLEGVKGWYSNIIRYIEDIKEISEPERVFLMVMYNRGIREATSLFREDISRMEYGDTLSKYTLGVSESMCMINDMIDETEQVSVENDTPIGRPHLLGIKLYAKGLQDAARLERVHKLSDDIFKLIKDVNTILSVWEKEGPEEVWEKMRNRIGVSVIF